MVGNAAIEWERANPREAVALDERFGYRMREVQVIRMLDQEEAKKWWAREHVVLGSVLHPFDGNTPADRDELLAYVHEHFGPDAGAVY